MNKQELARKRNWFKHQMVSYVYLVDMNALHPTERILWKKFQEIRKDLLNEFDCNSRLLGLNVPKHKCFYPDCRNKVIAEEISPIFGTSYVCKKHYGENKNHFKLIENEDND